MVFAPGVAASADEPDTERCCGLDVHKKTVAACVRVPGSERIQHVRTGPFGMMDEPVGATEAQLRARYEAEQVERGTRPPPRALCSFCGRTDLTNAQAVRAHLQRCEADLAPWRRLL